MIKVIRFVRNGEVLWEVYPVSGHSGVYYVPRAGDRVTHTGQTFYDVQIVEWHYGGANTVIVVLK